jgi:arylsulfatase
VLTDQERYFDQYPASMDMPGRRRLLDEGVSFTRHYIASTVCTSSRSVIYTGQHMPVTGMFDNVNFPFVPSLSTNLPSVGDMLRRLGYYTAYKGKWHLTGEFEPDPERDHSYVNDMEEYGFADWNPAGDVIGNPLDGFVNDINTLSGAVSWLRTQALKLGAVGTPWFLSVDLVNPHDVMYFNTDVPGEPVQDTGGLLFPTSFAPDTSTYRQRHDDSPVPDTWQQPIDDEGRPAAHAEYHEVMATALGAVPGEIERWERFRDYYFNCIIESDRKIARLLDELDDLGLADDTAVVFTSDHGDMQGAHGLRGKGANAYEEDIHVPFFVRVPEGPHGVRCSAVTSHVDLAPTFLGLTGVHTARREPIAAPLPGRDMSPLLDAPEVAPADAVRDSALFATSMVLMLDAEFVGHMAQFRAEGKGLEEMKAAGIGPDLSKRGFIRTLVDGRYKFSRYFAPNQHNVPQNNEELHDWNDVELFDLEEDPDEMVNLAARGSDHDGLVDELSRKLNVIIAEEVGTFDDGRYLPQVPGMSWAVSDFTNL